MVTDHPAFCDRCLHSSHLLLLFVYFLFIFSDKPSYFPPLFSSPIPEGFTEIFLKKNKQILYVNPLKTLWEIKEEVRWHNSNSKILTDVEWLY